MVQICTNSSVSITLPVTLIDFFFSRSCNCMIIIWGRGSEHYLELGISIC